MDRGGAIGGHESGGEKNARAEDRSNDQEIGVLEAQPRGQVRLFGHFYIHPIVLISLLLLESTRSSFEY
jgi:hypothetical protein